MEPMPPKALAQQSKGPKMSVRRANHGTDVEGYGISYLNLYLLEWMPILALIIWVLKM